MVAGCGGPVQFGRFFDEFAYFRLVAGDELVECGLWMIVVIWQRNAAIPDP